MSRTPGWSDRLITYVESVRDVPHAWGTHDCLLFGASCAEAITGIDPAAAVRGTYTTQEEAMTVLAGEGFATLAEALAATFAPIDVPLAQRGDLGTVMTELGESVVVCIGDVWVAPGTAGLVRTRPTNVLQAFRVE